MSNLDPAVLFRRQAARAAFGVALIAGAAYLVTLAVHDRGLGGDGTPHAARLFEVTWLAAAAAAAIAFVVARFLRPAISVRWLAWSMALPSVGLALVLPLTVHLGVSLVLHQDARAFDDWVVISLIITAAPHLVLAVLVASRAAALAAGRDALRPRSIFGWTVFASCLPFVVLFGVPPILVALTGQLMVPLLHWQGRVLTRERPLALATDALPRAILHAA